MGNYCELGTEYPTPCPNGTFSNTPGLTADTECTDCTQGYYCNGVGLTAVSGDCKQGEVKQAFECIPLRCPCNAYCHVKFDFWVCVPLTQRINGTVHVAW